MKGTLLIFLSLIALLFVGAAAAHEVRPAYLEIDQTGATTYRIVWKQPTLGDVAIHLAPHLSNGWLERAPADQFAAPGYLIRTWSIDTTSPAPLAGRTVSVEGLADTITDVFVRIRLRHDQAMDGVLRPEAPSLEITLESGVGMGAIAFLRLGVQHILTGPDHLLFVLGLMLLVKDRWALVKTVTAFTAAHSLTLAAATFGLISLPISLLNTLIALSILFLAPEIVRARRGETSLTIRHPWTVAFVFGLLHGLGFAGGLRALGLETGALAGALIVFNLGVEIGQLAFIALILALDRAFRLMALTLPRPFAMAPTYLIGILGAAWTFQYGLAVFGAGG